MTEELRFDDRVAIVTGAGGGLGFAYAELLAARGAKVVVNDLGTSLSGEGNDESAAATACRRIAEQGGVAVPDQHSVADTEGAEALIALALSEFGRLDILINNAGIIRDRSFVKSTPDDFDAVIAVHLRGTYLTSAQAFRHMREAGYGRIVNTTSAAGLYGNFGQANYSAAKLGIVGLSRTMAIEGASRGVSTNVIAPGAKSRMTDSPGVPGLDAMKASLVAPVVAWLSHESCTENGQVYSASSGRVCRHFIGETPGIYDPELTIETVARRAGEIADATGSVTPDNITEHMEFSEQVRSGAEVSTS